MKISPQEMVAVSEEMRAASQEMNSVDAAMTRELTAWKSVTQEIDTGR